MKKLKDIKGYVRLILGKLPGIRADLARLDNNWQEWNFCQLVDSLKRWTGRNPKIAGNPEKSFTRVNLFQVRDKEPTYVCVYCEKPGHISRECELVSGTQESRLILSKKKLCVNCTGPNHRASDCRSNKTCTNCKGKHHTSICEKTSNVLLTANDKHVTYPLVIIDAEGIKCHALIDTGGGASYASSTLFDLINKRAIRKQYKRIKTILSSVTKSIPVYSVEIRDSDYRFKFQTKINKLWKSVFLELSNSELRNLQNSYQHLKDIKINDYDEKCELLVYVILGVNDYTRVKTKKRPRVELPGELVAELTKLGWFILSPEKKTLQLISYLLRRKFRLFRHWRKKTWEK